MLDSNSSQYNCRSRNFINTSINTALEVWEVNSRRQKQPRNSNLHTQIYFLFSLPLPILIFTQVTFEWTMLGCTKNATLFKMHTWYNLLLNIMFANIPGLSLPSSSHNHYLHHHLHHHLWLHSKTRALYMAS